MLTKNDLEILLSMTRYETEAWEIHNRIRGMLDVWDEDSVVAVIKYSPQLGGSLDGPSEDK